MACWSNRQDGVQVLAVGATQMVLTFGHPRKTSPMLKEEGKMTKCPVPKEVKALYKYLGGGDEMCSGWGCVKIAP